MQKSTLWTAVLALLATLALTALPAAAQTPDQPAAGPSAAAPQSAGTIRLQPAPIEQAKPLKCGPHEQKFYYTYYLFPNTDNCETLCTSYCQDNSGYLLSWYFDMRGLTCSCTCCG